MELSVISSAEVGNNRYLHKANTSISQSHALLQIVATNTKTAFFIVWSPIFSTKTFFDQVLKPVAWQTGKDSCQWSTSNDEVKLISSFQVLGPKRITKIAPVFFFYNQEHLEHQRNQ